MSEQVSVKACRVTQNIGRYNLLSSEEQVCIGVMVVFSDDSTLRVSETWDLDDDRREEWMEPEVALDLIEERSKSYWISTGRDKKLADIAQLRAMLPEITSKWAEAEIAGCQRVIDRYEKRVGWLKKAVITSEEEVTQ